MLRVLIVEDDPMVAAINRSYLSRIEGFSLAGIVPNGREALALLEREAVSLLLLDISMPAMDGFELLREVRTSNPNVDVIMVTAARAAKDIQDALRLGVIDYLVKPFTFERFSSALVAYRERIRLLREEKELDQDSLDKRIFAKQCPASTLPKGIENFTLELVCKHLAAYGKEFSLKEIAPLIGLSRVSLKKYIDHLEATGCVASSLVHLPVGRPVTMYRWMGGTRRSATVTQK